MTFTADMVIYLLGVAAMAGTILARIGSLEKKVDEHNKVVKRTFVLEEKVDVANHRIADLEEEIKEVRR